MTTVKVDKGKKELQQLFRLFLRLGLTAFGGPAAHIAMMQKEVVDKRGWMDHEHFLDLIGATNLIPGPNSTEMAIHIGQERAGWRGLLVAGACFICPAVILTGFIAWLYQQYGQLPQVSAFIFGIKPVVIPVILAAALPLAKRALKKTELWVIAIAALVAGLLGMNEIYVMFGTGLLILFWEAGRNSKDNAGSNSNGNSGRSSNGNSARNSGESSGHSSIQRLQGMFPVLLQVPAIAVSNARIFFSFLKIGAILYGSGYVLFAFLDSELVAKGLLSRKVLIDAIAVGQFTPGPVFSSVTFIGWQMGGWKSAALATLAIFLPSFVFVALSHPLVPRMRKSRLFSAFLDGVNAASVAIILTVCISFGEATIINWRAIVIALSGAIVVFGFPKVNTAFVILGGALMGYLLSFL
jgi:chromate transporter